MIYNTKYTKKAEARILYKELDNGDEQFFVISITHDRGQYRAHWELITQEHRGSYISTLSYPTADYNGQTIIKDGRFSLKYLEKADNIIRSNLIKYFELWKQGEYQRLCNEIHADINK